MKSSKIVFLLLIAIFLSSCNSSKKDPNEVKMASILFSDTLYNFGDIDYEADGRCYFEFTNTSKEELIIHNVKSSCGCTRPEWPENPIKPGEKGKIGITYNTKLPGTFHKNITVYCNTEDSPIKLFIKGNVAENKSE